MKKFSILFLAFIALLSFSACTQDDDIVFVAQPDPEGIQFSNSFQNTYVLPSGNPDNLAERFVWNEVDFNAPTTITYELQGSADEAFGDFMVIGSTDNNNLGVSIGQMRDLAEDAGLDNDPETEAPNTGSVYFKVRAFAGDGEGNALEEFSETIGLNVELPEAEEEGEAPKMELYLVGDATAAGWDPANNNTPLFRDGENENIYYFEGRFAGGGDIEGFKFLQTTAWQPQWGLSNGELTNSDILGNDPNAFPVEDDAYYSLMVNVDEMTYTWEEIDESAAEVQTNIGIIGDATPGAWDDDTDMTQSEFNPHIWYIEGIELTDGEAKFRADDAWDLDWGGATPVSGETTVAGPNIPVIAGTYDVWFNTLDGRYIFIPQGEE
ncbi:SusE outer membrane protein [Salegentibacter agarivorans]|uniref:SusE outer membrane protein n=1 Tax=Salegentibacter agarivorans TaxID=345907 RepID=A0A1I2JZB7_9FLAO|nr:SusF/SusE family outer membrane protein [Salegentibacter agarivorans]SFF59260.1 SusE outer membrane protein [Salegentibacter agarivorans]